MHNKVKPYITRLEEEVALYKGMDQNNKAFMSKVVRALENIELQKELLKEKNKSMQWRTAALVIFAIELLLALKIITL